MIDYISSYDSACLSRSPWVSGPMLGMQIYIYRRLQIYELCMEKIARSIKILTVVVFELLGVLVGVSPSF